jgi:outer membrane protein assembly factor BamB
MRETSIRFPAPPPADRGHRLWFPTVVGFIAAAGIAFIRFQPEMERNFKGWLTSMVVLLAVLLGLIWFLLLSRIRGRVRLVAAVVLALAAFGATKALRLAGTVDGTGLPKLAWKWTSAHTAPLAAPVAATTLAPASDLPDVPQFFGANRDGVVKGAALARDWSATPPKQLWRQPIGAGWSAFAVVGGRAFTQEQRGEDEAVTCYDVRTGQLVWMHTEPAHFTQWQGGEGPRATPTVDRGQVFAIGATGILQCLDAATGQLVWKRDILGEYNLKNLIWGVSASPLVFDDTVVVTGGLTDGPTVLAFRRTTGEPLWKSGSDKASYASPILATLAGQRAILSVNAASLTAHDPTTGDLLLDFPWSDDKWPKAAQPVVLDGDRVFLSAGYGIGCQLLKIDATSEGKLAATQLWKNNRLKTQFNSVAVRDGFFYGLDDGLLACVEIATGERKWKDGRFGSGQTLLVDDLILVQSEQGPVVLAAAQPDAYHELGRLPALSAKTWNHPTLAGHFLLLRNDQEAVCYELPTAAAARTVALR